VHSDDERDATVQSTSGGGGTLARRTRKLWYEAAYNYYQNGAGEPESRDLLLQWRAEFQTSDALTVSYTRNHDRLESPFAIAPGVRLPTGDYEWQQAQIAYTAGAQRRVSGTTTVSSGTYYNGTQRAVSFRGRVRNHSPKAVGRSECPGNC